MTKTALKPVIRRVVVPFHLKAAVDPATHTFEGLAAVIGTMDLGNDIIEPGAFKSTLAAWKASGDALPLLDSHNQYSVMAAFGQLIDAKEQKDGLWTKWEIIAGPEGDAVMMRLMPSKVTGRPIVGKMSIGYIPVKWEIEQPEGTTSYWDQIRHLSEVELKECSLVLFPMAPGAAIDASTVKSFLLSAQATEAKSLDAVAKAELRKLATRIGVLLSKSGTASTPSAPAIVVPVVAEPAAVAADPSDDDATGTTDTIDVPDVPESTTTVDDDDELEIAAADPALDAEDEETLAAAGAPATPETPAMAEAIAKAQPYVFQEALQHRVMKTMLKNKVAGIVPKPQ